MAVFSMRDIHKGEEITFDYQFEAIGDPLPCRCGAENCRKVCISIYEKCFLI